MPSPNKYPDERMIWIIGIFLTLWGSIALCIVLGLMSGLDYIAHDKALPGKLKQMAKEQAMSRENIPIPKAERALYTQYEDLLEARHQLMDFAKASGADINDFKLTVVNNPNYPDYEIYDAYYNHPQYYFMSHHINHHYNVVDKGTKTSKDKAESIAQEYLQSYCRYWQMTQCPTQLDPYYQFFPHSLETGGDEHAFKFSMPQDDIYIRVSMKGLVTHIIWPKAAHHFISPSKMKGPEARQFELIQSTFQKHFASSQETFTGPYNCVSKTFPRKPYPSMNCMYRSGTKGVRIGLDPFQALSAKSWEFISREEALADAEDYLQEIEDPEKPYKTLGKPIIKKLDMPLTLEGDNYIDAQWVVRYETPVEYIFIYTNYAQNGDTTFLNHEIWPKNIKL